MNTLKYLGITLLAMVLVITLTSCSDDDKGSSSALEGTKWEVVSLTTEVGEDSDYEDDGSEVKEWMNTVLSFKKNGIFEVIPFNGCYYSVYKFDKTSNMLRIILGADAPDDYMVGKISINGNTATYVYHWADYDGDWEHYDVINTMTLKKK